MKYNGIIEAKLRTIEEKLTEIESWHIISYQQLEMDSMLRNATERALQVAKKLPVFRNFIHELRSS
jgi:hypothetical protein